MLTMAPHSHRPAREIPAPPTDHIPLGGVVAEWTASHWRHGPCGIFLRCAGSQSYLLPSRRSWWCGGSSSLTSRCDLPPPCRPSTYYDALVGRRDPGADG